MITELTPEQIAKFPHYVEKWSKIRDNTDRLDQKKTEEIIHNFQREILDMKETPVVIFDNAKLLWEAVEKKFGEKMSFVPCYQDGSFFAYVFAYYDYLIEEKLITLEDDLKRKYEAWEATVNLGLIYPFDDVCFVTEKPLAIHYNEKQQLHCETGPAMKYASGHNIYSLNGVNVPEYLVMTPSEDLDIEFFKKEKNADVKAEFVRKYGVERMLDLGKKLDSYEKYDQEDHSWWWKSEYELWDMTVLFPGLDYQPYLKMKNATTSVWHVEAVSPNCLTLKDALKERFGGRDMKILEIR